MTTPDPHAALVDLRIEELEKRLNLNAVAQQQAIELAANDLRVRLAAMNEFREALKDQASTFMPRAEAFTLVGAVETKVEKLEKTNWPAIFSVIGLVGAFWAAGITPLKESIVRLEAEVTRMQAELKEVATAGAPITQHRLRVLEQAQQRAPP